MLKFLGGIVIAAFVVFFLCFVFVFPFTGFHYETGKGEATGYITAIEKTGIIWKTGTVYLKTDTESTQEDAYCVVDPELYAWLGQLAEQHVRVKVTHISWLVAGVTNCNGEGAVITSVTNLAQ